MSTTKTNAFKAYWRRWLWSDMATRIITVNCIAWLVIAIGLMALPDPNWWVGLFAVPSSIFMLPQRIWTLGTYMISQYDFLHLLVNMIWMLLFGRIMVQAAGGKHVLGGYVCGGLAGGVAFIIMNLLWSGNGMPLIGASCAVLAVTGICLMLVPDWRVNLLLFGLVKVKWIVLAAVLLFVLVPGRGWFDLMWVYETIPHAAGFAAGIVYGLWLRRGGDEWVNVPKSRPAAARAPRSVAPGPRAAAPRARRVETQAELENQLDDLLDKVNCSGYSSLSPTERQRLFELSQKIKR
ncbi:MAG: rhomboid family intramembrane serine protease [Muribaculaceae bacterium]|nr:rhomboid family intramembrane serine protease [Muribaculaceae bacterium]